MSDIVTLSGILQHSDIGTGIWVLSTPSGTIELQGKFSAELLGKSVIIQGVLEENFSVFAISDQCLVVRQIKIAP